MQILWCRQRTETGFAGSQGACPARLGRNAARRSGGALGRRCRLPARLGRILIPLSRPMMTRTTVLATTRRGAAQRSGHDSVELVCARAQNRRAPSAPRLHSSVCAVLSC